MIVFGVSDKGKVQPTQTLFHKDGKIGGIGHRAVNRYIRRATHWTLEALCHLPDNPGVSFRGFKHETSTGASPSLQVNDNADPGRKFVKPRESPGPYKTCLFPVGKKEEHRTSERCLLDKDRRYFDEGGYRGSIVACPWSCPYGVVMAGKEDCGKIRIGRGQFSEQVPGETETGSF